ncbi:unnamed protein product [Lactuca saligna]|uniref:Uncharacterized protein n=1 Tax=Lactuca saligna TaxID=75948 RepID=A0AA35ZDU7_LACSI|nr:unnamed protein product [Lactuca saligna]
MFFLSSIYLSSLQSTLLSLILSPLDLPSFSTSLLSVNPKPSPPPFSLARARVLSSSKLPLLSFYLNPVEDQKSKVASQIFDRKSEVQGTIGSIRMRKTKTEEASATSTYDSGSIDEDGVDMNKHEDEAMRRKMELEAKERKLEETLKYQRSIEDEAKQKQLAKQQHKSNSRVQVFDVFKNQTNGHVEDASRNIKVEDVDEKRFQADLSKVVRQSLDYSAGNFYDDGRQAIKDILSRGHVPIVTGGTGLYLRWFIYGKPAVPKATPEITLELQLLNLYLPMIGINYIIMNLLEKPLVRISNSWPTLVTPDKGPDQSTSKGR